MEAPCPPPREPTRPVVATPPKACDTHCHVFGPASRFPYAPHRSYTPPDAPLAKYLAMLDTLGCERGVLVQGSAHGRDNAAMLDALKRHPERLRGVAVADRDTAAVDFGTWDSLGVRGLRFNHFFRDGQLHYRGGVPLEDAKILSPILKDLGWHLQLWIDVKDLPDTVPILKDIGLPVVIDHMGRTDAQAGVGAPGFQALLRLLGEGGCWVKLSGAHRVSHQAPDYPDARAACRAGEGKSRSAGVGLGLAASAHGRRDAERRASPGPVQRMDRGRRDPPPHPGQQSGKVVRISALVLHAFARLHMAAVSRNAHARATVSLPAVAALTVADNGKADGGSAATASHDAPIHLDCSAGSGAAAMRAPFRASCNIRSRQAAPIAASGKIRMNCATYLMSLSLGRSGRFPRTSRHRRD